VKKVTPQQPPSTIELFGRFLGLVAPGLSEGATYRGRVYRHVRGLGWRRHWAERDAEGAIFDHVMQGAGAPPEYLWDGPDDECGELGAVALTVPSSELVSFASIDLDGGYSCAEVVQAWRARFGSRSFVLTPGSGAPGRFRLWFRVKPVPLYQLRGKMTKVMEELRFPLKQGSAELYPDPNRPGRLPLGPGGCVKFSRAFKPASMHPWELLEAFEGCRQLDFSAYNGAVPASVRKKRRRAHRHTPDRVRVKGEGVLPPAFRPLWRDGAQLGHRRWWLREMVVAWHRVGKSRRECHRILQATAASKLVNTRGWRSKEERRATRDDITATVDTYYNQYKQALPAPAHLTAAEVRRLVSHCEKRAGIYFHRGHAYAVPASDLIAFGLRALEQARACWLEGWHPHRDRVIDGRLVKYRFHRSSWEKCARGTGVPYYVLRRALDLFADSGEPYLPEHLAQKAGEARCKAWLCCFRFGGQRSPRRPIGGSSWRARAGWTARAWARSSGGVGGGRARHCRRPPSPLSSVRGGDALGVSCGKREANERSQRTRRRSRPQALQAPRALAESPPRTELSGEGGRLQCRARPPPTPPELKKFESC
jgi:hypothetical protein